MFTSTILLPAERGLSTFEIGTLLAIQGFIVLGFELPSGALSDTIGRRPFSSQAELSQSFPGPSPKRAPPSA